MATLQSLPYWQVLDDTGLPASGALIYAYYVGTSTPRDTYTTYQGTIPSAWPVVCDSEGRAVIFLGAGLYKFVITDSLSNILETIDGVGGQGGSIIVNTVVGSVNSVKALAPNIVQYVTALGYHSIGDGGGGSFYWGANIVSGDDDGAIIAPTTPDVLNPGSWIRIFDGDTPANILIWGAQSGQVCQTAFSNALTFCANNERALAIPAGTYYLNSDPGFSATTEIVFDPEAVISWSNAFTPAISPVIGRDDVSQHFAVQYVPNFTAGTEVRPEWFTDATATTDYSPALQQCINSVSVNGGVVRVPDSSGYTVLSGLTPAANVQIIGQTNSKIVMDPAFTDTYMMDGTASNFAVNKVSFVGTDSTASFGLRVVGANVDIQGNSFSNLNYPLTIGGVSGIQGSNIRVEQNEFYECNAAGVILNSGGVIVDDNRFDMDTDAPAIAQVGATAGDVRISNNVIEMDATNGYTDAILLSTNGGTGTYTVTGNYINGSDGSTLDAAIKISDMSVPVIVDGNIILGQETTVDGTNYWTGTGIKESGTNTSVIYGPGNIINGFGVPGVDTSVSEFVTTAPRYIDIGNDLEVEINGDMTALNSVQINNNLTVDQTTVLNDMSAQNIVTTSLHTTNMTFGPNNVYIQGARSFPVAIGRNFPFRDSTDNNTDTTGQSFFNITYQEFFNLIGINIPYVMQSSGSSGKLHIYPHLTTTDSTTLTVNTNTTFTLNVTPGLQVTTGGVVQLTAAADVTRYMRGTVTSYDPVTGILVVYIGTNVGVGGTETGWNISFASFPPEFPSNSGQPISVICGNGLAYKEEYGNIQACAPGMVNMTPTCWTLSVLSNAQDATIGSNGVSYATRLLSASSAWGEPGTLIGVGTISDGTAAGQTITPMVPSV